MNSQPAPQPASLYELRIDGHLGEHWSTWFDGLSLTHADDGTTTLRGPVTDQAALHGLLAKVRDLGATLLSAKAIDATPDPPRRQPHQGPATSASPDPKDLNP